MTLDVVSEVVIKRPRAEVYRFAANPENAPRWYANISSVEWRTAPAVAVGARAVFVASFLGTRLTYVYEIVELVPLERLVMRASEGPFPMETSYGWRDGDEGGTRMLLRNRGEPAGFSRLMTPLLGPAMLRANRKDLALLEAG